MFLCKPNCLIVAKEAIGLDTFIQVALNFVRCSCLSYDSVGISQFIHERLCVRCSQFTFILVGSQLGKSHSFLLHHSSGLCFRVTAVFRGQPSLVFLLIMAEAFKKGFSQTYWQLIREIQLFLVCFFNCCDFPKFSDRVRQSLHQFLAQIEKGVPEHATMVSCQCAVIVGLEISHRGS